jgi:lysine 6-dehydrogenase
MAKRAIVLGGGMVGSVMACDLARNGEFEVTLADRSQHSLAAAQARARRLGVGPLTTVEADLSDPQNIARLVSDQDVVLGAIASHLGYGALEAVAGSGKPFADISFMPEDALELDAVAKKSGSCCVVDCGVAPGMSNLLAGWGHARLERTDKIEIYVGGLPVVRTQPFEYKAGFAPSDVIEEYTRPSRVVENSQIVVKEALTEAEPLEFAGLGTLEAFNTDGLRSLVRTLDVPNMVEKTMRYPGHAALMAAFRAAGLFSKEPVKVNGQMVVPLELTSRVLFPKWTYEDGEEDLTVMRVEVTGELGGKQTALRWDLADRYSQAEGATSMSRTTALPCTSVARLLLGGTFTQPGVHPPETLGAIPGMPERILASLAERGVQFSFEEITVAQPRALD